MDVVNLLVAIIATASALSIIVVPTVEMLKMLVKGVTHKALSSELVPTLSCFAGVALALALLYGQPNADLRSIVIGGFAAGLIGSRLFDAGQAKVGLSTTTAVSSVSSTAATPTSAARTTSAYTETTVQTTPIPIASPAAVIQDTATLVTPTKTDC